jgi:hypothetical protein
MRLEAYGIKLRSICQEDLEMVRQWRNAPHVRENMEFREVIHPADQQKWFADLDAERNLYLLASHDDHPFAVLHVKDIDWESKSGEAGIFVGDEGYLSTFLPVLAVLAMMDLVLVDMGMSRLEAKVRSDRPEILDFNRHLGYSPLPDQQGRDFVRLQTTPEAYLYAAKVLRRQASRYQTGPRVLEWEGSGFAGRVLD